MSSEGGGGRPGGYTNRGGVGPEFRSSVADQTRAELVAYLRSPAGRADPDAGYIAAAAGPAGVRARAEAVRERAAGDR